ncbi:hypothetical protein NBM05_13005 [Rothia sp. AR01]|uniref:Uncharacterized protein n=1 Tax=Rothia santali TaxID=2949643 RepID=A0A9X2HC35_9MICC|nr:hypothetical protein [Rothia santali]MCP3426899.1 hypothetical protein [Rothia santali]
MSTLKEWSSEHRDWVERFVLDLRSANVPEREIGEELADAHARCEQTGGLPEEVLGHPDDYAEVIGYPVHHAGAEQRGILSWVSPVAIQAIVALVGTYALRAWIEGTDLTLNLGTLICWLVMAIMISGLGALVAWSGRRVYSIWLLIVTYVVALGAGIAGALLSRTDLPVVAAGTPMPLAVTCAAIIVLIAVTSTVREVRGGFKGLDPVEIEEGVSASGERRARPVRKLVLVVFWVVPAYLALDAWLTVSAA